MWYSPRQITFTTPQVIFLVQNLTQLREGQWPADPSASRHIGPDIKTQPSNKAPFETPCQFAAEIESRLERCGRDGIITINHLCYGQSEESLSAYFKCNVSRSIDNVLEYCTGWARKRTPYWHWKKVNVYRKGIQELKA